MTRPETTPASVLIVDDHEAFRTAMRAVVEAAGLRVAAEASSGEAALVAAAALSPDVVLLDVGLPGLDGITVAERLASRPDAPRVILMSIDPPSRFGKRLQGAPVHGFIAKRRLTRQALLDQLAR